MMIDAVLTDTFAAHEYLSPDAEDVLDELRERLDQRRSAPRRRLAVAASVVVVGGAAAAVAMAAGGGDRGPQRPVVAAQPTSSPTPAPSAEVLTMPFDLGWVPDGDVHYLARRVNVGGVPGETKPVLDGEYMMAVTTPSGALDVDVQQMPGGLDGAHFKCGTGVNVTVSGRPGIEDSATAGPCGYEVYFVDADGGLMYVNVLNEPGAHVGADTLTAIGRHVANEVRFPGTTQVTPAFGLSNLPDGLRVRAFDVETPPTGSPLAGDEIALSTTYQLGTATGGLDATVGIEDTLLRGGTPGREVQGHLTRVVDDSGYRTLEVLGAVGQHAVGISSRELSVDELYQIADGLVLPA